MLNRDVHPVIPSQGSVGASGDLAPLAHLAQVAIGEGEAIYQGPRIERRRGHARAGIAPLTLEAKEGLALLNGTQAMLALLASACATQKSSQIPPTSPPLFRSTPCAALPPPSIRASPTSAPSRATHHRRNLMRLNEGSEIRESHRSAEKDPRVQDPYSLRCTPQVHGAVRDAARTHPRHARHRTQQRHGQSSGLRRSRAKFSAAEIFTASLSPWPPINSPSLSPLSPESPSAASSK